MHSKLSNFASKTYLIKQFEFKNVKLIGKLLKITACRINTKW